jgi:hypothetical protein
VSGGRPLRNAERQVVARGRPLPRTAPAAQEVRLNSPRLTLASSDSQEVRQPLLDRAERSAASARSAFEELLILQGQDAATVNAARRLLEHMDIFAQVREATERPPDGATWEELALRAREPAQMLESRLRAWQDDFVLIAKADLEGGRA